MSKNGFVAALLVWMALLAGCGAELTPEAASESAEIGTSQDELSCGLDCPYGWVPSYYVCTSTCGACTYGHNAVQCAYVGQQASISGSPQQVSVRAGALGTSRICWSTNFLNAPVWIRVRVNGQAGQLFTKESDNGSECANAPWIGAGNSYVFSVHTSNSDSAPVLASTTVTGVLDTSTPPPPPSGGGMYCDDNGGVCQSGYDCRCGDICRPRNTLCP